MFLSRNILLAALATTLSVLATPIDVDKRAIAFTELKYPDFQISTGTAGDSAARANAVFAAFQGADLSTVSSAQLKAVNDMRVAAENAESTFNTQISAAGGTGTTAGTALQNGKIANKVLKLTAEVLALNIETAQGNDQTSKTAAETKKLNTNIALDVKSQGQGMTSVQG